MRRFAALLVALASLPLLVAAAAIARLRGPAQPRRLVWGSVPIINNSYWARAMRDAGFPSETFTTRFYAIHTRADWDRVLDEEYRWCPGPLKPYVAFAQSLVQYDVFFIPFSGYFLGGTHLARLQHWFFALAGKKVVVISYGADAYSYRRIRNTSTIHALLMSYPQQARMQDRVAADVDYWVRWADCVIPGVMGPDGLGRWDVLSFSPLFIDLDAWRREREYSDADGTNGDVVVVHAPNHRGFKGTEFLLDAVERLRAEGLRIRLVLLEGVKNSEVRRVFLEEADILVEQLICPGHGFNAVEGLTAGLVTVSNLESDEYLLPFRRWSYLDECPIASASPETIRDVLRALVTRPGLRRELGKASRAYAEKYHGFDTGQFLFKRVIELVNGDVDSILNMYHPLIGEYPKRAPRVTHPLRRNRIVS